MQSRYYDPETGRFINADDARIMGIGMNVIGGTNLFSYCLNNPVNDVDPNGEFVLSTLIVAAVIGAAIGAISSCITQQISGGSIDGRQVLFDALVGGISGAVGATGIGVLGAGIAGFAIGFGGSILNDVIMKRDIDWKRAAISGGIGAITAGIGAKLGGGATKFANNNKTFIEAGKAVALDAGNRLAKHTMYLAAFNAIQFAGATTYVAGTAIGLAGTAALAFYDYYA